MHPRPGTRAAGAHVGRIAGDAVDFLASLRAELPEGLSHHLFFGFETKRNPLMLYSHDTVVAVASQLEPWYQERAERVYGYDLDHVGVLNDENVAGVYHQILDRTADEGGGSL